MPIKMKVCNVAEYNESLKKRGYIFHLFDEATKTWFYCTRSERSKFIYSDRLVEIMAMLRYLYRIPYRQLEGWLEDYIRLKHLNLPIPDFTTLCRRMNKLAIRICDHRHHKEGADDEILQVILDSTGISIYPTNGSHGKENSRYRKYHSLAQVRKMHVALNAKNKKVLSMDMTENGIKDHQVVPFLLADIPNKIGAIYADGAYDKANVRAACVEYGAKQVIPPSKNAIIHFKPRKKDPPELWNERNAAILSIWKHDDEKEGRKQWKEDIHYGWRSLVEAFFGRFKSIFGFYFMSRNEKSRKNELIIKAKILNSFKDLGGAIFKKVA